MRIGSDGRTDDEVEVFCRDACHLHGTLCGYDCDVGSCLAVACDMSLVYSRFPPDPVVGRDEAGHVCYVVVCEYLFGKAVSHACDSYLGFEHGIFP